MELARLSPKLLVGFEPLMKKKKFSIGCYPVMQGEPQIHKQMLVLLLVFYQLTFPVRKHVT